VVNTITNQASSHSRAGVLDDTGHLSARSFSVLKQLATVILAVILVLVLLEVGTRFLVVTGNPPMFGTREFDSKFHLATTPIGATQDKTLFFLGTSHALTAIYPELLKEELNPNFHLNAINLATSGGLPENQVLLLKAAVKSGYKPAAVFYEAGPLAASDCADLNSETTGLKSSAYGNFFITPAHDWLGELASLPQKHLYIVRYRSWLKLLLMGAPKAVLSPDGKQQSDMQAKELLRGISPLGWSPYYKVATKDELSKTGLFIRNIIGTKRNLQDPTAVALVLNKLQPIQEECRALRIPLVLVWMPEVGECEQSYKEMLNIDSRQFANILQRFCAENKLRFLDLHNTLTNSDYFADCTHVNAAGGTACTKHLAALLNSHSPQLPPLSQ